MVLEKTLESPLDCKEIQPAHPKGNQFCIFIGRIDVEAETPILWPPHVNSWLIWRPWCWERLRAGREEDYRGWDGWMASPTQRTLVWVNSRSWWQTERPGMLRFTGSQSRTQLSDWTEALVAQSCLTVCNPKDCSLPDSSGCGILQAQILEWVAISFSRFHYGFSTIGQKYE